MDVAIVAEGYNINGIGENFEEALTDANRGREEEFIISPKAVTRYDTESPPLERPKRGAWASYNISSEMLEYTKKHGFNDLYDVDPSTKVLVPITEVVGKIVKEMIENGSRLSVAGRCDRFRWFIEPVSVNFFKRAMTNPMKHYKELVQYGFKKIDSIASKDSRYSVAAWGVPIFIEYGNGPEINVNLLRFMRTHRQNTYVTTGDGIMWVKGRD